MTGRPAGPLWRPAAVYATLAIGAGPRGPGERRRAIERSEPF
ncbi:hypothetical protein [Azospirillum endophyticum]